MTQTFKAGDKVTNDVFGAGEIVYGPYDGYNYFFKGEDGNHYTVSGSRCKPAAKFKVGDKVRSGSVEYTVKGGPFFGPAHEWYAIMNADGVDYQSNASFLRLVEPAGDTYEHDGVTYDLTARYRDRDGDVWKFERRPDGKVLGTYFSRSVDEYDDELSEVVSGYGPLTRV